VPDIRHLPVLAAETLASLNLCPGATFVDATIGGGGHAVLAAQILGPAGRLVGLDADPAMLGKADQRLASLPDRPAVELIQANFAQLRQVLDQLAIDRVDAILADLGFASDQVEDPSRGLSFATDGPLDMRLDPRLTMTAADLVAALSERDLSDLFYRFGEERHSRRIARRIVQVRQRQPFRTTRQLAELIRQCVPRSAHRNRIDPATRVFQALRIAVNDELQALSQLLSSLPRCLRIGGRAVLISFHSLEDRLVKQTFRDRRQWQMLHKKPVTASAEEVAANPRARSAKLRAAEYRPMLESEENATV
jgi:16S rRNA (cytosine1402-N4)-methyltransferase